MEADAPTHSHAEHDRLDEQARHISTIMNHHILHSPLSGDGQGKTILDVGTGTGYVADTFGRQLPSATVYGLDLSAVPGRPDRPNNVHFLHGNFVTEAPTMWRTAQGGPSPIPNTDAVDLVFARLLHSAISDWPRFVKNAFHVVRPGGWVEVHELDSTIYEADESQTDSKFDYREQIKKLWREKTGLEVDCALLMAAWMKDAGLVDIQVARYNIPLGPAHDIEAADEQAMTEFFSKTLSDIREYVYRKSFKDLRRPDEIESFIKEVRPTFTGPGKHNKFVVTYGRKPQ